MSLSSAARKRWVIKAGSNLICQGGPLLLRSWMQQVSALKQHHGIEVIWVTSGAIATAIDRIALELPNRTLPEKQALSAIGQPLIMDLYNLSLQATGLLGAQVLLTYDDLANEGRRTNFQNTLEKLLEWKVTPILNENDAIATDEIKFGDNDSLSAQVACVMGADRLVILTDVEGLYIEDPRQNPKAELLSDLEEVTEEWLARVSPASGSKRGTGGMASKLQAAKLAQEKAQIETWLVKGESATVLVDLASGKHLGTRIGSRRNG